jgi:hypothetical protein
MAGRSGMRSLSRSAPAAVPGADARAVLRKRHSPDSAARAQVGELRERLRDCLPYAVAHGVRVLAGTDVAGTIAYEIALLANHILSPGAGRGWLTSAWLSSRPALQATP